MIQEGLCPNPGGSSNTVNKMKIAEDAPFDEDIPFDERTLSAASRTRSGLSKKKKKKKKSSSNNTVTSDNLSTGGTLVMPKMLDDIISMHDDDQSDSEASEGSHNSAQVLEDLNKLSRFMMERKQSSKGNGESRRSRGGAGSEGVGGRQKIGSRKSSFGSSRNRSSANKYSSDPSSQRG